MAFDPIVIKAYEKAMTAQNNAHAPYSNFQVGAAFKIKNSDEIIAGCNVENASYGATVCAERVAVTTSVASFGKPEFEFLVVVTNTDPAIGPCALCLQVLSEFCAADMPIYLANKVEIQKELKFNDFLPSPFSSIPEQI